MLIDIETWKKHKSIHEYRAPTSDNGEHFLWRETGIVPRIQPKDLGLWKSTGLACEGLKWLPVTRRKLG